MQTASSVDYGYLRDLVFGYSQNVLDSSRDYLFDTRLSKLMQRHGMTQVEELVQYLRIRKDLALERAIADAMTINETSFFRDSRPFELLRTELLPKLIEARASSRALRFWSAACSTGQESYSLAMLLCESFPEISDWDVKIIGTDISTTVIEYARRGRYRRLEVNRGLPARMLVKYLTRDGDEWEVSPRLRPMCDFQYANLCAPLPKLPIFDLILLRNVLLYFPQQDRSCVFSDVYRQTAPCGYLLLGASEQAEDSTNLFHAEFAQDCYFYRPVPER